MALWGTVLSLSRCAPNMLKGHYVLFSGWRKGKNVNSTFLHICICVVFFCNPCSSLMGCPGGHLSAAEHLLKIRYDFIFFPEIKSLPPFPSLHMTDCRCAPPGVRQPGRARWSGRWWPRRPPFLGDTELRPGPPAPSCSRPAMTTSHPSQRKRGSPRAWTFIF